MTQTSTSNPLLALQDFGQAVWLDYISRKILDNGELARLVEEDGVRGVTSNPAIFEKSISAGSDYDAAFRTLSPEAARCPKGAYEAIAIADIRRAADVLRPVYDRTQGADGFVSLEVSPELAHDTEGTLAEARSLWAALDKPNALIKVPATPAGIVAIRRLIEEGISVNVTLLFAREAYEAVAWAFVEGLEARAARGEDISTIASVASFFVSRIDSSVDALLDEKAKALEGPARQELESLRGKVAIANAKLAYQSYKEIFGGARFQALAKKGARAQRVLWASTGTKNPAYRDVLYVEELIGDNTVNTVPLETLVAFRDHGAPRASLEEGVDEARAVLERLERSGISLTKVTSELLADGVKKFVEPFDKLLAAIAVRLGSR